MENQRQIQSAIDYGYDFKMGEYVSKSFEIFKNNPGGYIGYTIIIFTASIFINFIVIKH